QHWNPIVALHVPYSICPDIWPEDLPNFAINKIGASGALHSAGHHKCPTPVCWRSQKSAFLDVPSIAMVPLKFCSHCAAAVVTAVTANALKISKVFGVKAFLRTLHTCPSPRRYGAHHCWREFNQ